jgi:hypothetical protein
MAGLVADLFHVTVKREDGFWVGVVEGVRGGATETRRLDKLESEIRDLLAGLLDLDEDDIKLDVDLSPALGADVDKILDHYRALRNRAAAAEAEYERAQIEAVCWLREADVSLRDAGKLLGISFQRVQQVQHTCGV